MFPKKKEKPKIDPEQRAMFEYAQSRVKQKKNLFRHFVVFIAGAVLLIILNLALGFGENINPLQIQWFVWAILIWFFLFLIHLLNVFLIGRFMNKKWENEQIDKLVEKQKAKIIQLQDKIDKEFPLPEKKTEGLIRPDQPLNS